MTDLAKRLAEGPGSRELSREVLTTLGYIWSRSGYWLNTETSRALYTKNGDIVRGPAESVDDALALVPEGWLVLDLSEGMGEREGWFWCTLHKRGVIETNDDVDGETQGLNVQDCMARAICLAVLEAT